MAIAMTLDSYLNARNVDYSVVKHRHTDTAFNSARSAHVPSDQVCKAVILKNQENEYLMTVVPANRKVLLDQINKITQGGYILAGEDDLSDLFEDCEPGAVPGIGEAYQLRTLVDDNLLVKKQVYLEAGDHTHLLRMNQAQYSELMKQTPHAPVSSRFSQTDRLRDSAYLEW